MLFRSNSLYSTSMLQPMPVGGFREFSDKELESFDLNPSNWDLFSKKGSLILLM